jgi:hypothetical protein
LSSLQSEFFSCLHIIAHHFVQKSYLLAKGAQIPRSDPLACAHRTGKRRSLSCRHG